MHRMYTFSKHLRLLWTRYSTGVRVTTKHSEDGTTIVSYGYVCYNRFQSLWGKVRNLETVIRKVTCQTGGVRWISSCTKVVGAENRLSPSTTFATCL